MICRFEELGEYLKERQQAWTNGLIQSFSNLPGFERESTEYQAALELNQIGNLTAIDNID
ncbi:MAG: hypothetical protein N0C88_03090 [Candidatus Thiodiazotropha lotti]|uniref:Uncharacterized protein n=1 Tax=Candidatus Thiodiazotropha lotti TaxID=2792787 RepID=A0A9E4K332_9GAMM|nr:hypothetical protein [Candidatus Thiodiazotropha lotti]MCG7931474.1 hypothetical protein [Candidatus Thiodiazotropha lotti]MCG7937830.1 hypothetical protein [Candidatus Thiodiazotropha lotti]MCG7989385.1 hypothetical protein [Candidatus Thiodiazotropha lotti]MCG8011254.1 hypothetical protein [Candidatus Thiodiazotropha lotti]